MEAADLLYEVLIAKRPVISSELLQEMCSLPDRQEQVSIVEDATDNVWTNIIGTQTLDCSPIRQLACRSLSDRGIPIA
jgi:hypothetical protein